MLTLDDIHVYQTLQGSWRAYVIKDAGLQAWGINKDDAIRNLAEVLTEAGESFIFDD